MVKNQNKAKIMAKKPNKDYAIRLTPQLSDGLRYISDRTHKTQIGILEEILTPVIQQAISYESFTYEVYPDRNMVEIIFYGSHGNRMIFGKNTDFDDDSFANEVVEKLVANASAKKSKADKKAVEVVAA